LFLQLIEETRITQDHDKIIKAINDSVNSSCGIRYAAHCSEIVNKTKESILAQKALILTVEEKHKKRLLKAYTRTYGEKIGQQLAEDIEAAGDDLTKKHEAVKKAEAALNRPLKEGVDQQIDSSNPRRKKP